MNIDTSVQLGSLSLPNPVILASGTSGYGYELEPFMPVAELGAVTLKALSLEGRRGNPPQRIAECRGGILNAIGLQNMGWDDFAAEKLPRIRAAGYTAIANISGNSREEYATLCSRLDQREEIAAVELNVSCPNVKKGGIAFGQDAGVLEDLVKSCRQQIAKPLIVKLSPNVTDITVLARAAEAGGADILSAINTLIGMRIDIHTRRPQLANVTGGFSGPAIKPVALHLVHRVHRAVTIPVIGMGGIMNAEDALEFILAGASAVAVGTATLRDPGAALQVRDGIVAYCQQQGIATLRELIGSVVY